MSPDNIGPLVAFLGGVLSFISPCVLPLVPVYLSIVTGYSLSELKEKEFSYKSLWSSLILFITGFTMCFVFLGASATTIGDFLNTHYLLLKRIIGAFLIFWAFYMWGIFRISAFSRTFQVKGLPQGKRVAPLFIGMAFGLSWSPCVGSILVPILSMAALKEKVISGMFLLFCYSMGIALPFVVVTLTLAKAMRFLSSIQMHYRKIEIVTAGIIFMFGLYLIFGGRL
ncbi:MAG: hypothetical protein GXO44_05020 [Deferribacteres bacterium]|nr:hypothetical protein [Deferribacteres bacterium]